MDYYCDTYKIHQNETVYIGDNPQKDIIGMKKLGLKTIWMRNARTWKETDKPDAIVDNIPEVLQALNRLA